ncbi:hypothetical protein JTB14_034293 [Gonioctena quinquepunctata]|nr:hypothetical protein JTB14_034293 [Gonioctena quinquepunctata]
MVSGENQDLWNKLGKLMSDNKKLREQLGEINETVNLHIAHTPKTLTRSKTFTQTDSTPKLPHRNLEINEKIILDLENISLKLSRQFFKTENGTREDVLRKKRILYRKSAIMFFA